MKSRMWFPPRTLLVLGANDVPTNGCLYLLCSMYYVVCIVVVTWLSMLHDGVSPQEIPLSCLRFCPLVVETSSDPATTAVQAPLPHDDGRRTGAPPRDQTKCFNPSGFGFHSTIIQGWKFIVPHRPKSKIPRCGQSGAMYHHVPLGSRPPCSAQLTHVQVRRNRTTRKKTLWTG